MCRLFGLSAGRERVHATFWLLDAPDSLQLQGRRNRDGTGLGYFDLEGHPVVEKRPIAAYSDIEFISDAKTAESSTFIAHVRIATTGELTTANTHPFEMDGRLMAHNGGFGDLDILERELGADIRRVAGDTDSERYMALVSRNIARRDGDVGAGIVDAVQWLAEHVTMYSLNMVLTTATDLWALRYPDRRDLFVLERPAGGASQRGLEGRSDHIQVSSERLRAHQAVVVASETMDEEDGWRLMQSGELLHVGPDLGVTSSIIRTDPPVRFAPDPETAPT